MKPAAQIQATIELLDERDETQYPADRLMAGYFKQRRYIGSKDKAAISEHFYAVLRQRNALGYLLSSVSLPVDNRGLVAVLNHMQGQAVAALFNGDRYSPVPFSADILAKLASIDSAVLETAPQHVRLNYPEWLEPSLSASLGDRLDTEMLAMSDRASTDIRVNTLKASRDQLLANLTQQGLSATPTPLSPWGLRFDGRVALFNLQAFRDGWFEVQDEGSQLLAWLTQVQAGQTVVDFCAGAGGKSLAMAAMMGNKGALYACDVHSKRLGQLAKRKNRAGVHNIRTHVLSSEQDKWVKQHAGRADMVLVDAPCSGTGTWRRSPDSRWNLTPIDVDELVALQRSILTSAQRLVKPGGKLVYATCSLLNVENHDQAAWFAAEFTDFVAAPLPSPDSLGVAHESVIVNANTFQTLPALSDTDAFFLSAFERQAK
ncbi:rRNA cytosine-C5-methylase [Arenicella chitinivorans]|uniref:rRNA cytosine-C5-methylase n=1 Tax=Arenicella chitinivorans TaxID=1329800 RepID=A0A918RML9_9GAMM|nr:RsmB/NOP family class I SAM-dependent RNA methyltransferase [Arenicella chitinivorans]GHA02500.1 rRNA cytosine-C5-methylase [Arenicella chitinivorans]